MEMWGISLPKQLYAVSAEVLWVLATCLYRAGIYGTECPRDTRPSGVTRKEKQYSTELKIVLDAYG